MRRRLNALSKAVIALICLAAAAVTTSLAQGRGGGGPGGGGPPGGGGGGMNGGGRNGGMNGGPAGGSTSGTRPLGDIGSSAGSPPNSGRGNPGTDNQPHAGLQVGPPGQKWWDDKSFAKSLKLRPEQQTRMDAIFEQNKTALVSHLQNLHQAESQMEEVSKSPNPDETSLFTQIDRVSQARADLEKATTHMLLQIRKEMDSDQITRLEKHR